MIGTTSSGTLMVLLGTYVAYVHESRVRDLMSRSAARNGRLAAFEDRSDNPHEVVPASPEPAW